MGFWNVGCLGFAMLMVVVGVLTSSNNVNGDSSCPTLTDDTNEFNLHCNAYIFPSELKTPPSQECCNTVKQVEILCLCQHCYDASYGFWVPEKIVHVADYCGKPLPHGTKCPCSAFPYV
ncbi:Bifunctional inhibitor/plant lipid transfer protein/seed storage helical domain [Macleaya cordata]|uniref:Bifunctional inhibitor/plant lipid transfer protein/seed storage helical domain n=1 Tax=Macleaya cordata TaxID=56857 RepID=A0A200PP14_MACCD|nr:Bifunctional inhibitor/plant lipid transfer protein/seed storage helical domain [Macleaya cordata]